MSDFFNYVKSQETAKRLIAKFGQVLTFSRVSDTGYDEDTRDVTRTETEISLKCIVLPARAGKQNALDEAASNDLVLERYRYIVASVENVTDTPKKGDKVTFEGSKWEVNGCTPVNPAGVPLVFKIAVQR